MKHEGSQGSRKECSVLYTHKKSSPCMLSVSLSPPGEATHSKCAALREGGGSWGQIIPLDLLMVSA